MIEKINDNSTKTLVFGMFNRIFYMFILFLLSNFFH